MSNKIHPVLQAYNQGLRIYKKQQPINLWVRKHSRFHCTMESGFFYYTTVFNFLENPYEWSIHPEDINLVKENIEFVDNLPDTLDINGIKYQKIK